MQNFWWQNNLFEGWPASNTSETLICRDWQSMHCFVHKSILKIMIGSSICNYFLSYNGWHESLIFICYQRLHELLKLVCVDQTDDYACLIHRPWKSNLTWQNSKTTLQLKMRENKQTNNTPSPPQKKCHKETESTLPPFIQEALT